MTSIEMIRYPSGNELSDVAIIAPYYSALICGKKSDCTYNHEGKEDQLWVESLPDDGNLQEEITLLDRLDRC